MKRLRLLGTVCICLAVFSYNASALSLAESLEGSLQYTTPISHDSIIDDSKFDQSLTSFIEVVVCRPSFNDTCIEKARLNSSSRNSRRLRLEDNFYLTVWKAPKYLRQETIQIFTYVAGMEINNLAYVLESGALPIKFHVSNNPRIRTRVLTEQGFSSIEIATALLNEFALSPSSAATLLNIENFNSVDIALALRDVYQQTAMEMATIERELAIDVVDIGLALKDVYALPPLETTVVLKEIEYNSVEIGGVLLEIYQLPPLAAAEILQVSGHTGLEITLALRDSYQSAIDQVSSILRTIGFSDVHVLAEILTKADYPANEIHRAVLPLLVNAYAPVVYFHSDEQYLPSTVEWYIENAEMVNNQNDVKNILPLTDVNELTKMLLACADDVTAHPDCPAGSSDDWKYWFAPVDDSRKNGDLAEATTYIHMVHPASQPEFFDVQFWLFYPYNGSGTLFTRIGEIWDATSAVPPIGEHTGDWEVITLRFEALTFEPVSVFLSAHGDFPRTDLLQPQHFEGTHPVVYSSKNGHANYIETGNHPERRVHLDFIAGHIDADLLNLTNGQGEKFETHTNYKVVAHDGEVLPGNDWIYFPGRWGPAITETFSSALMAELMMDHLWPAFVAAETIACPLAAVTICIPSILLPLAYPVCVATATLTCGTTVLAGFTYAALDPDTIVNAAYAGGLNLNGPSSPSNGSNELAWLYAECPKCE